MWVTRIIEAPAAHAWRVLVDTTAWPKWGPSVVEVQHEGRFLGPGSRGRVRTIVGPWLTFEITRFEEGRIWSWSVGGVQATSHSVESLGPRRCRVGFELPMLAAPYALVCGLALHRIDRLARARP